MPSHLLRKLRLLVDSALASMDDEFDAIYARAGRPSAPPERLLKGQLLIALYSIRSDRQFCEQLDYNILFRWFLDMDLESASLDQSSFSRLRERLVATDVSRRFFDDVVSLARRQQLLSSEHFTVDGTMIAGLPRQASVAASLIRTELQIQFRRGSGHDNQSVPPGWRRVARFCITLLGLVERQ